MIVCLDMDCFFVSVERKYNPKLHNRPVIVAGSSARSVISACSYEARQYGLRSGMAVSIAKQKCQNIIHITPHMHSYQIESKHIYATLKRYCPIVEPGSIDEFYLDFKGCERLYGNMNLFIWKMKQHIEKTHHLPCSIGTSQHKVTAKMACKLAKPNGMVALAPENESLFFAPFPISLIPGIGPKTYQRLKERHIHTIQDLHPNYIHEIIQKHTASVQPPKNKKEMSIERTFETDLHTITILNKILSQLTETLGSRLRNQNQYAQHIRIKVRYSDFKTLTKSKIITATAFDNELYQHSCSLLKIAHTRRLGIRCLGVTVGNLQKEYPISLFGSTQKLESIYTQIDESKKRYGSQCIQRGTSLYPLSTP